MATNIPPHNLREVVAATTALIDDPDLPQEELETLVTGPDFPTGGFICGREGIRDAYRTGRGTNCHACPGEHRVDRCQQ